MNAKRSVDTNCGHSFSSLFKDTYQFLLFRDLSLLLRDQAIEILVNLELAYNNKRLDKTLNQSNY